MSEIKDNNRAQTRTERVLEDRLVEGEKVLATSIIHPGIFWKPIALFIIGLVFFFFVAMELGILLFVFALLYGLYMFAIGNIFLFVVTDRRVLARYGLLMIDVVDVHFDKIESIELERMLPGYLLGYANLVVMGTGNRFIVIPYVANGNELRKAYNHTVLKEKK